jgi:hypothetical protein
VSFSSIQPADRQRDLGAHTCQCTSCFDANTRRAAGDDSALSSEIDTLENLVNGGAESERGFDTFHCVHRYPLSLEMSPKTLANRVYRSRRGTPLVKRAPAAPTTRWP